ncbi:MAG: dehypoxanthine futalosine cyclase [Lentisphaerae bacterium]|nr:dehypoxanthine futalosine cyclase [Lentisphaerota bacterium]
MDERVYEKALAGERLTPAEGLALFAWDLSDLGRLAQAARQRHNPGRIVTFVVDLNLNLTNVCAHECAFCAFWRKEGSPDAYLLSDQEIANAVAAAVSAGASQVMIQGGVHPGLSISDYERILRMLRLAHPQLALHVLSPTEIAGLARADTLTIRDTLTRLRAAGMDSLPGGGAEILVDRVRNRVSPRKISACGWLDVMETAHQMGMRSTATMMFGCIETHAERIDHLDKIRALQDRTGGFRAFIPWTFLPANTRLAEVPRAGGLDYLQTLAISRIYLDNIQHIATGWLTEGIEVAQLGLFLGADDFGGTLSREEVIRSAGGGADASRQEIERAIRLAGFFPARRNTGYEIITDG